MKYYLKLITITSLAACASVAMAQSERDYGDLVPEDHFQITNAKTTLKDNADISNYQISTTPKKDEFVYKVNSVKTPRGVLVKKKNFKLEVNREDGKVTRFSSVSFSNHEDKQGSHAVQTTTVNPEGFVSSHTNCNEDYKRNFLGGKSKKTGFNCVTVTAAVCEYLEKNKIDESMVEKINSCSEVLGQLAVHQENLHVLSKSEHKKDLSVLTGLNGRLAGAKNFYALDSKTLQNVAEIVLGYGNALETCKSLKEKNYLEAFEEKVPTKKETRKSKKIKDE